MIGFKFAQPFLINRVIDYIQEKGGNDARKDVGYALVGATGLVYFGLAVSIATRSFLLLLMPSLILEFLDL